MLSGAVAAIASLPEKLRLYERALSMRGRVPKSFGEGPWSLSGRAWAASIVRTVRGAADDDYGMAASAIAFSSFLALLPLLGAVALFYGLVTPPARVVSDIRALLVVLPGEARSFVGDWLVASLLHPGGRGLGLAISSAIALYSALRAGRSVIGALNVASDVATRRSFIRRRFVAFLIVIGGALLILGALFAISALSFVERFLPPTSAVLLPALRTTFWIAATLGAVCALAIIYRHAPARAPPPWCWMLPGALAGTLLWLAATVGFGAYLGLFGSYRGRYGSIGAVIVLQIWLFLSGYALLLGAKLNTELMRTAGVGEGEPANADG